MRNKIKNEEKKQNDEMLENYSFKKGVRGKHFKEYRKGHSVRIYKDDGSVSVQHFTLEDGAIMLDPDLKKYFPDSDSVNKILRTIINLKPKSRRV